jgi:hypothetical protein
VTTAIAFLIGLAVGVGYMVFASAVGMWLHHRGGEDE